MVTLYRINHSNFRRIFGLRGRDYSFESVSFITFSEGREGYSEYKSTVIGKKGQKRIAQFLLR